MNAQDEKQITVGLSAFKNLLGMLGAAAARNGGELRIPQGELVDYERIDPVFLDPATMDYVLRLAPKGNPRLFRGRPADLVIDEFAVYPEAWIDQIPKADLSLRLFDELRAMAVDDSKELEPFLAPGDHEVFAGDISLSSRFELEGSRFAITRFAMANRCVTSLVVLRLH